VKAELTLPPELVKEIAKEVIELLKPMLSGNGKHETEDKIFDKKRLSEYLKLSQSAINKLIVNKQIPYFKIQPGQSGGVRFHKRDIDKWISRHTTPELNPLTGRR
jgi:excisionase family DNA binding protein